ncbi:MAG: hypothetical protein NVS9B4_21050 [Candidatus Acidiferrum sp.]
MEKTELKVHLGVENDFRPARNAQPAFLVEDLPPLKPQLVTAGYAIESDEALEGYDRGLCAGNRLELMEPLENWFRIPADVRFIRPDGSW